jgi:hypothetical protein
MASPSPFIVSTFAGSLGDNLAAGSSAVMPIVNQAGPGIPFFAPASGGGGGASTFTSSFNAPVANGTSTLLMSLPPGTWAYNGQMLYSGSLTYTAGFLTSLKNLSAETYYASIMPFAPDNNVPPDTNPNGLISISDGNNPLSTVNVYAVNPSTLSGDANWVGAITKL